MVIFQKYYNQLGGIWKLIFSQFVSFLIFCFNQLFLNLFRVDVGLADDIAHSQANDRSVSLFADWHFQDVGQDDENGRPDQGPKVENNVKLPSGCKFKG